MRKIFSVLLAAIIVFAVFPLGAFAKTWKDDWTFDDYDEYVFDNAYGFVFYMDSVDGVIKGEDTIMITNADAYSASFPDWAISVSLKKTETEGVYSVCGVIIEPGSADNANIDWSETDLVMVVHSAFATPSSINYRSRCAAAALTEGTLVKYEDLKVIVQNEDGSITGDFDSGKHITWSVDSETDTLIISGECDMEDYSEFAPPWTYSGYEIKSVVIEDGITSIGSYAFDGSILTSVTIPDSVNSIGGHAFERCSNLTSVTIPDSVTSVGEYAFSECTNLTSVTIPNSVTSIGDYAFRECTGLTSVIIGDGVNSIGGHAFEHCSNLESVTIPDSVAFIGESAFISCTNLTSAIIGDGVTSIGESAFISCTNLTSVTIGDRVTSIGDYAFYCCSNLTSVTIPDSVTSIGKYAFRECTSLTSAIIGDGVTSIGGYAFQRCSNLTNIIIPDSVTSLGISVFEDCTNLTSATIGDGITAISSLAFHNCTNLTSIAIGNNVVSVYSYAFDGCIRLESVIYGKYEEDWNKINIDSYNGLLVYAYNNSKCAHEKGEWNVLEDNTKEKVCTNCGAVVEVLGADDFIPNDINGDNKFNMFDYVAVKSAVLSGSDDQALLARVDVNGDGKINMFDYVTIKATYFAQ